MEVSHAMVHSGPVPATSDARTTSVGSRAIERFLRPVSYENLPQALLPEASRDGNPLTLLCQVNGDCLRTCVLKAAGIMDLHLRARSVSAGWQSLRRQPSLENTSRVKGANLMSKAWQQTLLSSGLPLENDIFAHMVKRGCVGRFEYSYLKPNENSIDREFSYDVDASYIRGPYFMNLMIECKYRHPGARWVFAPAEYGGSDELEANDFLHVIDDFMTPKFGFRHHFPRRLAPLCSKGVELLADNSNEKTITQATHQLAYALAPHLASSIDHQANRWLAADMAFFHIPVIVTTAELFRLKEGTTIQDIRQAHEIEEVANNSDCLVLKYFAGAELQRYNRSVLQAHLDRADAKKLKAAFKSYTKDLSHWYSNLADHQCPRAMVVISIASSYSGLDRLFDYLNELVAPSDELRTEIATQEREFQEMVKELQAHTKTSHKKRAAK